MTQMGKVGLNNECNPFFKVKRQVWAEISRNLQLCKPHGHAHVYRTGIEKVAMNANEISETPVVIAPL